MYFVTGNQNKLREAQGILGKRIEAKPCDLIEIQSMSVEEVSRSKVEQARKLFGTGQAFFIEDTGLFIDNAGGFPGALVKFMYESIGSEGMCKFANSSKGYAETVIGYCDEHGQTHFFSGKKRGCFVPEPQGGQGFGWDSVFLPRKSTKTYAEMSAEEKNKISHRARAFRKFKKYLKLVRTNKAL